LGFDLLLEYLGLGASPAAGQIDPKAIARQAIMK